MNTKETKDVKALKKDARVRIETKGSGEIVGVEIGRINLIQEDHYVRNDGLKIKRRRITKGVQEITSRRANTNERKQRHRDKADPTIIINQVKKYEKAERIEKNRSREEKQIIAGELGEIDKINRKEEKALKKKIQSLKNEIEEIAIIRRQQELKEQINRLNETKHKGKDLTDEEKRDKLQYTKEDHRRALNRLMIEELTEKVKTKTITDHNDIIRETIKGISEEVRARRQKKEEERQKEIEARTEKNKRKREEKEERAKEETERIKMIMLNHNRKTIEEKIIEKQENKKFGLFSIL